MERNWDAIDEQCSREGEAARRIAEYSPRVPNTSAHFGVPKRLFSTDICHRIEMLEPHIFRKYRRSGELKTL
jgi:hypothetical protein